MRISVHMLLSLSVSGIGFVGADIGGFDGHSSETLLVKWHWLGLFYPFMRQHCHQSSPNREPYLFEGTALEQIR